MGTGRARNRKLKVFFGIRNIEIKKNRYPKQFETELSGSPSGGMGAGKGRNRKLKVFFFEIETFEIKKSTPEKFGTDFLGGTPAAWARAKVATGN